MKRLIIYILVLSTLFVCAGCGEEETPTDSTAVTTLPSVETEHTAQSETVPAETESPITVTQQPMTAVYLPIQIEDTLAEDGTVIFRQGQQSMVLTVQDPDVADRIILDFLSRTDNPSVTNELIEAARNIHAGSGSFLPLCHQTLYAPQRIDQNVMSLYGFDLTYQGAVHPGTVCKSVTYDLVSGNTLSFTDILTDKVDMEMFCELVISNLESQSSKLFPDYKELVRELFKKSVDDFTDWYLSTEGLCFYFSPYEIASYSSGNIIVTVPYSDLSGKLNDAYFPPEQDVARGTLIRSEFDETALSQFTQIAEVPLGADGRKMILHTDYNIHDIRIAQTTSSIVNADYNETRTIFAAATLTPGDAIIITVPQGCNVTVTYSANGQTFNETV